jgi:Peptidase propeptide and YPEB domain
MRKDIGFSGSMLAGIALLAQLATGASRPPKAQHAAPGGKVTPWGAMKIAEGKLGGHAIGANFVFEGGHWIYDVLVVRGKTLHEIEIDSQTGKTDASETVTPREEAKEMEEDLTKALGGAAGPSSEKPGQGAKKRKE